MQCIYLVEVEPVSAEEDKASYHLSIKPHVKWLKKNKITRYRLPLNPFRTLNRDGLMKATFKFERKEDAMAFKLRWT